MVGQFDEAGGDVAPREGVEAILDEKAFIRLKTSGELESE